MFSNVPAFVVPRFISARTHWLYTWLYTAAHRVVKHGTVEVRGRSEPITVRQLADDSS
jgi:hypothetical protein